MAASDLGTYRSKAVQWQDRLLLPANVALNFLDDCEEKDIRLAGCEAFETAHNGSIRSLPDDGLDASSKEYWDYSIEELCEVFRDHIRPRSRILFEFELS
jgi:hypothetical protein